MPQKKPLRNPFYFFMLEEIPELRRQGIEVKGLRDAAPLCSSAWASLTALEKEKFVQMAHQWKTEKTNKTLSEPTRKPLQKPIFSVTAKGMSNPLTSWSSDEGVCDEVFHFVSCLSLADLPLSCEQRFLPCEIACIKYSMKNGITDEFHCFIDPGMIPCGFRYHCQVSSDATHKIPLSNFELASSNYSEIFQRFFAFLRPIRSKGFLPVYCKLADCFRVNWCLNWLASKAGSTIPVNVFELEELIEKLYEHKLKEKPSKASVERMLDVMVWDYATNTRCKWHDEHDVVYCALATTKKYAYCISDSLASIYEFEITSAHIPKKELTYGTKLNPKVLVLDRYYQQSKSSANNMTSRYFHLPIEATASSISSDKSYVSASNLRDYPIAAQFGRGRGALAAWLNFPSRPPPGFQQ
ncbi:protein maelstrom homolog isoform X1 [Heterodontus francisci]|uniref:protein maelstrom homolog isoform X1 n=1 Tax=Heterodontus francisci TaxID=7792 RepID=UPI00355B654B